MKFAKRNISLSFACFSGVLDSLLADAMTLADGAALGALTTPLAVLEGDGR